MKNLKELKRIFKNKKILITGHTGFKGTWLTAIFNLLDAKIYGISKNYPNNFFKELKFNNLRENIFDLSDYNQTKKIILKYKPDYIFHLAAQAIVSRSYSHPLETWKSNLLSFLNILESLRFLNKKTNVVMITSDKCYLNIEKKSGYKEHEILGGYENYSASKASCEILFQSYFHSYFKNHKKIKLATARAGNVIGGGDWSKNRLIPDIIKSIRKNETLSIRNLSSTRPWQHVLEPLSGYICLAINLKNNKKINGQSFNFGPKTKNYTVKEVLITFKKYFKNFKWKKNNKKLFKESKLLKLNCEKAKNMINWEPKLNFHKTIFNTIKWYNSFQNNPKITNQQIVEYFNEK
tara:strand:+ start:528 stop:1577 length:1050 start_codon:yes stop_codon:yes gene_type:complete